MSWLTNFVRPRLQSLVNKPKDIPENLWTRCPSCEQMIFCRELQEKLYVCPQCSHHMRMSPKDRFKSLFDHEDYTPLLISEVPNDPLNFRDLKRYTDRLKDYRQRTQVKEAIEVARGLIVGNPAVMAVFNFDFMGGSMGTAVGEALVDAAAAAHEDKAALIVVTSAGGARMQEGILSLMQMPRTIIAISRLKKAGLPYIVLLADPTTGGVAASFAMLGNIAIAEPGAMIGFAGPRVIEQTIRAQLPPGFQKAEYLLEHGMIDMVVPRPDLKKTLGQVLGLLMHKNKAA